MEYVLITGVSSGIGKDALGYLTEKGYHVFGSVRKKADAALLSQEFPDRFTPLVFDVTKTDQIRESLPIVVDVLAGARLSGLVNNAGMASAGPIELMEEEDFRYQMEVNLFSVRNVTNIFLPLLKGDKKHGVQGGKIIMMSSLSGVLNTPFNGAYCVSKHALESLSEIYRRELMIYNIDVVTIRPGPIQSKIWNKNIDKYEIFNDTDYARLVYNSNEILIRAQKNALPAIAISIVIHKILTQKTKSSFLVIENWLSMRLFVKFWPARWVDRILYNKMFS